MEFKWHLLIGFTISYILIYFFNFSIFAGIIIFLSSWSIDIDHYFWYAFEMKDWNPIHAINWYKKSIPKWFKLTLKEREDFRRGVFIFHGITFLIVLIILASIHRIFLWILIGVVIHMIADWGHMSKNDEPLRYKIFQYHVIRRNKNKKGVDEL